MKRGVTEPGSSHSGAHGSVAGGSGAVGGSAAAAVRPDDASPIVVPSIAPTIRMRATRGASSSLRSFEFQGWATHRKLPAGDHPRSHGDNGNRRPMIDTTLGSRNLGSVTLASAGVGRKVPDCYCHDGVAPRLLTILGVVRGRVEQDHGHRRHGDEYDQPDRPVSPTSLDADRVRGLRCRAGTESPDQPRSTRSSRVESEVARPRSQL